MGHDKKTIDKLFHSGKTVKPASDALFTMAERLEQKDKLHSMAAQILLQIEKIEE